MSESYSICKNMFSGHKTVVLATIFIPAPPLLPLSSLYVYVRVFEWMDRNQEKKREKKAVIWDSQKIHKWVF